MKFTNILYPTDFSSSSKAIFKDLIQTKEFNDSNIYLLNVVDVSNLHVYNGSTAAVSIKYAEEIHHMAKQKLEAFKHEFFDEKNSRKVSTHICSGETVQEICTFVEANKIDLIVMPTHGRKGLSHLFLGSITEKVIRAASCPIFTMKHIEG